MLQNAQLNELLDEEIIKLHESISELDKTSKEYGALVEHLSTLNEIRSKRSDLKLKEDELDYKEADLQIKAVDQQLKERELDDAFKIKPETILTVAGSLAGIIAILGYERAHIVTSKAIGFVLKKRV